MLCPFCSARIKESLFAESENFMGIYNLAPILPGHSLVIPKRHIESIIELKKTELVEMTSFARDVTDLLLGIFKARAFNWSVQDGEEAGQTLAHLHLHIVPRFSGDLPSPGSWYPRIKDNYGEILDSLRRPKLTTDEMSQIVNKIRTASVKAGLFKEN